MYKFSDLPVCQCLKKIIIINQYFLFCQIDLKNKYLGSYNYFNFNLHFLYQCKVWEKQVDACILLSIREELPRLPKFFYSLY